MSDQSGPVAARSFPLPDIARGLTALQGVAGVVLGGSRGIGLARPDSDFDLNLVHAHPRAIAPQAIARALTDAGIRLENVSGSGGLLRASVNGIGFEIFQTRLPVLEEAVRQARTGSFRWLIQPLFPHGNLSLLPVTHLVNGHIVAERGAALSRLKSLALPFPMPLQQSLSRTFMRQASNACMHAAKVRAGGDQAHFMGLLSLFVFSLNIVMYALNGRYPVLEKGGGILAARLPLGPQGHGERIAALWPMAAAGAYPATVTQMQRLLAEMRPLVAHLLTDKSSEENSDGKKGEKNLSRDPGTEGG